MRSSCTRCACACAASATTTSAHLSSSSALAATNTTSSSRLMTSFCSSASTLLLNNNHSANSSTYNATPAFSSNVLREPRRMSTMSGIPSSTMGLVKPHKGFVSTDIEINLSAYGGQFNRGYFAKRKIPYGREIIAIPAFATYTGDEPQKDQVFILTRQMLMDMVEKGPQSTYTKYVVERVLSMMSGGKTFFLRDQDLQALIDSVPNANNFLDLGIISPTDLQKLPQIIEFNRYDVEFRGKKGICVFPEASYFNHMCEPNVEINIRHDVTEGFILSAHTCRPIEAGEELFISYMPGNDMPLSRLVLAMRRRWGFECQCAVCKTRFTWMLGVIFIVIAVPFMWFVRTTFEERFKERARKLG